MWVSVFAFTGNLLKATCFTQMISDIGRVPDHRMIAMVAQSPGVTAVDSGSLVLVDLLGMLQVWMAVGALEWRALPAIPLAYFWAVRITVLPNTGAASKARLPDHYSVIDPERGEVLQQGLRYDSKHGGDNAEEE